MFGVNKELFGFRFEIEEGERREEEKKETSFAIPDSSALLYELLSRRRALER